jgi:hypothetical protein
VTRARLGAANDDEVGPADVLPRRPPDGDPGEGRQADDRAERIAVEFEPGVRYDEKEVNAIVGRFFNDYASLRRYLIDAGLLAREHGEYWRAGGRVDA